MLKWERQSFPLPPLGTPYRLPVTDVTSTQWCVIFPVHVGSVDLYFLRTADWGLDLDYSNDGAWFLVHPPSIKLFDKYMYRFFFGMTLDKIDHESIYPQNTIVREGFL